MSEYILTPFGFCSADEIRVADMIDQAATSDFPGHEMLKLEREGLIVKDGAKMHLAQAGDGWFNTLLEVEDRLIKERRKTAELQWKLDKARAA